MLLLHMQIRRYFNEICDNIEYNIPLKYADVDKNCITCHLVQYLLWVVDIPL